MPPTFTQSDSVYEGFPLPLELLREITGHLDSTEQRNMTMVSRVIRDQILDIVFKRISFSARSIKKKLDFGKQPREDVKSAVRTLKVGIYPDDLLIPKANDGSNTFFQFLRSFPNLRAFNYYQSSGLVPPRELFDSIRDAPLSELTLSISSYFIVEGPPTKGLASLERLSIYWTGTDSSSTPGGSLDHLYHLIQPSLATLIVSKAGETLRIFHYNMRNFDEGVLDVVPEIFPHLTNLALEWATFWDEELDEVYSLHWKVTCFLCVKFTARGIESDHRQDSHIASLSRNKNLLDLQLSFDFEYEFNDLVTSDEDYAWYIRCYKRRLDATNKLLHVMPLLRTCRWLHLGTGPSVRSMLHPFVIDERGIAGRTVRGVKQDWMGADRKDQWRDNTIVKCKLEDLPGDIIGENDPPK
ncbi:hypothetical protein H0H92_004259 [Tricholoma furcatifolium]|nr:hypothetical protein H0H92_004259 [Tricholoma furcatifolium]